MSGRISACRICYVKFYVNMLNFRSCIPLDNSFVCTIGLGTHVAFLWRSFLLTTKLQNITECIDTAYFLMIFFFTDEAWGYWSIVSHYNHSVILWITFPCNMNRGQILALQPYRRKMLEWKIFISKQIDF